MQTISQNRASSGRKHCWQYRWCQPNVRAPLAPQMTTHQRWPHNTTVECTNPDASVVEAEHMPSSRRSTLLGLTLAALPMSYYQARAALVEEDVIARVFQEASPSIVSIAIFKRTAGLETFEGVGTGIVWDSYGHIVTNYHCVSRMVLDRNSQVRTHLSLALQ
jgi:S1-C subfamily serine protease